MNDLVDKLADFSFRKVIQPQNFSDSDFPFEKLQIDRNGKKITGKYRREIGNLTGEHTAMKYFAKSGRINRDNFQNV